jgi:hypothetical protein
MSAVSSITLGVGLAISAIGTGVAVKGQMDAASAQGDAEQARKKQMELDAMRRKRESIREAIQGRSLALSNATSSGAAEGSGLQGGLAQVTGQMGRNLSDTGQNVALGNQIFNANMKAASAGGMAAFGSGMQDLGSTIASNNVNIDKVGNRMGLWG